LRQNTILAIGALIAYSSYQSLNQGAHKMNESKLSIDVLLPYSNRQGIYLMTRRR